MDNNTDMGNLVTEERTDTSPVITVVGVGGGGNNTLAHLVRTGTFEDVKLVIANTDYQHMRSSPVENQLILGKKSGSGHGAGMRPEKGREAAEESYDDIKNELKGSDLVIISAGLGGGTGTGASPVFARVAKECGALTIAVVTKPFSYEGGKRAKIANEGLEELYEICDSIVVIPNEKLLGMISKTTGYSESMAYVDDVVARAVNGISNVMLNHSGGGGVNVDFQDLCTIMGHKGLALMGVGEASGEDAADMAVKNAIESPLFGNMSVNGAKGVILNFEINPNYPLYPLSQSTSIIRDAACEGADIIWGTMLREDFDPDKVKVSVIVTGFDKSNAEIGGVSMGPSISKNVDTHDSKTRVVDSNAGQADRESSVPASTQNFTPPDIFLHRVKTSSSDYTEDELDTPTYLRHKKD